MPFTFGREREMEAAASYLRDKEELLKLEALIDAVHDLLDTGQTPDTLAELFLDCIGNGGSGVWEQAGSWLGRIDAVYPEVERVWRALADSPASKARFRVAAHLMDLRAPLGLELGEALLEDRSAKVREMAASGLGEIGLGEIGGGDARSLLERRLETESSARVLLVIRDALGIPQSTS